MNYKIFSLFIGIIVSCVCYNLDAMEMKKKEFTGAFCSIFNCTPDQQDHNIIKIKPYSEKKYLRELVTKTPLETLQESRSLQKFLIEKIESIQFTELKNEELVSRINEEFSNLSEKSPFFMINECSGKRCALSRYNNPQYRMQYVEKVVQKLQKIKQKKKSIEYTSFASGDLFQDIEILNNFLIHNPNAVLNIHCIDTQYETYKKFNNENNCITKDFDAIKEKIDSYMNKYKECSLKDLFDYFCTEYRNKSFIDFFKKAFPKAKISFYLYKNKDEYIMNRIASPDIIVAIDIDKERAHKEYKLLYATVSSLYFTKKIHSINMKVEHEYNKREYRPDELIGYKISMQSEKSTNKTKIISTDFFRFRIDKAIWVCRISLLDDK